MTITADTLATSGVSADAIAEALARIDRIAPRLAPVDRARILARVKAYRARRAGWLSGLQLDAIIYAPPDPAPNPYADLMTTLPAQRPREEAKG